MKRANKKGKKIIGWLLFLAAIGLCCVQGVYFLLENNYSVEYIDNRLFYVINLLIIVFMTLTIFLLLTIEKKWKIIISSFAAALILLQAGLMINHSYETKQVISFSPELNHQLVIKEDSDTSQAAYYRTRYGLFVRPKEDLPYQTSGDYKVKWLEKDIAAVTYEATDRTLHQYIGTYGARDGGISYSYVASMTRGQWKGETAQVTNSSEGIVIEHKGETEHYTHENMVQFGTLALVLMENNEAKWTIALNENFESNSNAPEPPAGEITLYKATMEKNDPISLEYISATD
ncbi:hypothetical protein SAMN05216353_11655 [Halobacillus alkaliphilus]|uniref:Uncharacterized protein n=1 Tax=Halobacillus alkaliphilus TaxID=396056 RepID=A0A1I2N6K8_9BACI|nr:hypothetical protein [Halobacillus alkaliphilus]SFF97011.1 hypothetical protein SAMN05216353_11655 [Halobacillus alkaliphilus]